MDAAFNYIQEVLLLKYKGQRRSNEVVCVRTLAAKSEDPNSVSETQRPEKTDSYMFFSGYHMCAMVWVDSQMHSKYMHVKLRPGEY